MLSNDTKDIEISLKDILLLIKRYRSRLLILPVISTVLAIVFVANIRPSGEATAVIQVGQIAGGGSPEIEANEQTIIRIKNMSLPDENNTPSIEALKVSILKNTQLIEIKLKTESAEIAKLTMQKIITSLKIKHNKLFDAQMAGALSKLEKANKKIQIIQAEKKLYQKKFEAEGKYSINGALYSAILQLKNLELNEHESLRETLNEQLNSERTFQTRTIGDITVITVKENIKKVSIIITALILGFCGSFLLAFLHKSYVDLD